MTWTEALEIVVKRTGHERYRFLVSDANPDKWGRDAYRLEMVRMADEPEPPAVTAYPSVQDQVKSALAAGLSFAASGFKLVDQVEHDRRMAICHACEFHDATKGRCVKCGCVDTLKARIPSQACPIGKWAQ